MKLNASTRLTAANDVDSLGKWFKTLSHKQQVFFCEDLPELLDSWLGHNFGKRLHTKKIPSLGAAEVDAVNGYSTSLVEFRAMILGMAHIRKIIKPTTKGKIYRLTSVKKLPDSPVVQFTGKDQYRSLTSWTTLPNPVVVSRETQGLPDVILHTKLVNADKVLFDYASLTRVASAAVGLLSRDYGRNAGFDEDSWQRLLHKARSFAKEKEVLIYLHPSDSLTCTWRPY